MSPSENLSVKSNIGSASKAPSTFNKLISKTALIAALAASACGNEVTVQEGSATSAGSGGTGGHGGSPEASSSGTGGNPDAGSSSTGGSSTGGQGGMPPTGNFSLSYLGEPGEAEIGKNNVSCLNLEITNTLPYNTDIKDWQVEITELNPVGAANGLVNTTVNPPSPNFTLDKLARINDDGTVGATLLGPSELDTNSSDESQNVTLTGLSTIQAGGKIKASVILNVANNAALVGDKIRCTLKNVTNGLVLQESTTTPVPPNQIIPNADIAGNPVTIIQSCDVTVSVPSVPMPMQLAPGTQNALLACWGLTNTCPSTTVKSIDAQRYGAGSKDDLSLLALYQGSTKVSNFENISGTDQIIFNNLNVALPQNSTISVCVKGNISFSATPGDQNGFNIPAETSVATDPPVTIKGTFPAQGPLHTIN